MLGPPAPRKGAPWAQRGDRVAAERGKRARAGDGRSSVQWNHVTGSVVERVRIPHQIVWPGVMCIGYIFAYTVRGLPCLPGANRRQRLASHPLMCPLTGSRFEIYSHQLSDHPSISVLVLVSKPHSLSVNARKINAPSPENVSLRFIAPKTLVISWVCRYQQHHLTSGQKARPIQPSHQPIREGKQHN